MILWVALPVVAGLALLSLRSMASAFAGALGSSSRADAGTPHHYSPARYGSRYEHVGSNQAWMMLIEIGFSIAIVLMILGLSLAAAMPLHLMLGALLAQLAVIGTLVAPPTSWHVHSLEIRPTAIALGIAQLAHLIFFLHAIDALLSLGQLA